MFVNKLPFFITFSRGVQNGTVESLANRCLFSVAAKLISVLNLYHHYSFRVTTTLEDNEFEQIQECYFSLNTCVLDKYIPEIKQSLYTVRNNTHKIY